LKPLRIYLILTLISYSQCISAQKLPASNLHKKYILVKDSSVTFDTLSIVPNTFSANNISPDKYHLDIINASIVWKEKPEADSVLISYRTFPYKLNAVVKQFNYDSIRFNFAKEPLIINPNKTLNSKVFDFGNINYNGNNLPEG
jgi:hypothetical protein